MSEAAGETLHGTGGDDVIRGGWGVQEIEGGAGQDRVDYGFERMEAFAIEILGAGPPVGVRQGCRVPAARDRCGQARGQHR